MRTLNGQTVAIVGGSSGIGLATARAVVQQGATAILISRSPAKLQAAAASIGTGVKTVAVDMLDHAAVNRAFSSLGTIDHVVLTAVADEYGIFGIVSEITPEQIEQSFNKLRGYAHVTKAVAPVLRKDGSLTLLSGAGAVKPPLATSLAAAANASIVGFAKALAMELAPVRVNTVMPGAVDTPLHGQRVEDIRKWATQLPARHVGSADDIAGAICFVISNPYVTGHTLVIDGGYLMT